MDAGAPVIRPLACLEGLNLKSCLRLGPANQAACPNPDLCSLKTKFPVDFKAVLCCQCLPDAALTFAVPLQNSVLPYSLRLIAVCEWQIYQIIHTRIY